MKTRISARSQIDVDSPSARTPELRVDNHIPRGFVVEDHIIVKGRPTFVEQHVRCEALVSCEGIMYAEEVDFEDIDNDAVVRFSASRNVELSTWHPYIDNTWGNPSFSLSSPMAESTTHWVDGRMLRSAPLVTTTGHIELENYPNDSGTMAVVFVLSPTEESSSIVFDDLVINVRDGLVEIHSPSVSTSRPASIGNTPTILSVVFNEGTCDIYVKAGYEAVSRVQFPATTTGSIIITGRLGIFSVDIWNTYLFVPSVLDQTLRVTPRGRDVM